MELAKPESRYRPISASGGSSNRERKMSLERLGALAIEKRCRDVSIGPYWLAQLDFENNGLWALLS